MDFFQDFHQKTTTQKQMMWQLQLSALRSAFGGYGSGVANADLHRKIAASIIGCFTAGQFDSVGVCKSLWLERLEVTANDTQGWIDELFCT